MVGPLAQAYDTCFKSKSEFNEETATTKQPKITGMKICTVVLTVQFTVNIFKSNAAPNSCPCAAWEDIL